MLDLSINAGEKGGSLTKSPIRDDFFVEKNDNCAEEDPVSNAQY